MDVLRKHCHDSSKLPMSWNTEKAFETSRLKENEEKWQLNVSYDSKLDPEMEKEVLKRI